MQANEKHNTALDELSLEVEEISKMLEAVGNNPEKKDRHMYVR